MFSVGASPFNSRSRQLYGGWTLAEAGDNLWGQKQFYTMSAKYNPSASERKAAKEWLKAYRAAVKNNPARKKAVRIAGKPYWVDAIMPALSETQKTAIWNRWRRVPFNTDKINQIDSRMLRRAPYPNFIYMNTEPNLGVPYVPPRANIGTYGNDQLTGMYRNMDQIWAAARRSRGADTRQVAQTLGAAMDALAAAQANVQVSAQANAAKAEKEGDGGDGMEEREEE